MATLREYFDTDFPHTLTVHTEQTLSSAARQFTLTVVARVHLDFDANARFVSYYLPECPNALAVCQALLLNPQWGLDVGKGLMIETGFVGEKKATSAELRFTGRVFFYLETELADEAKTTLDELARSRGFFLRIRSRTYVCERSALERPLAFIAHDSRNKEEIARPLAIELVRRMCPVWFDEFSLKVGDSLRESIEKGIRECRKCILVLTPEFLANKGWTKREFNSVFTREVVQQERVVLPIWHKVSARDVYEYCPSLVDCAGIDWSLGKEEVARRLLRAIREADRS
ncbi:MAG: toll/interleukin-1 receptor domain-containing protein [Planctomycetes bacterium]|nr:toll/interleukin-1 receptor domain-containing protein [Planctomycetota bacterium]